MTKRAFGSQLAVSAAAAVAGVLAEAVVVALRADSAWAALVSAGWAVQLWTLPAAFMALAAASLLSALCGEDALSWVLADLWTKPAARDASLVGLAGASLFGAWVFSCARASAGFHNLELAAALVSLSAVGGALVLGLLGYLSWRALRRRRSARALLAGSLLITAFVWSSMLLACRGGLLQLDPRLLAAPAASGAAFAFADRSPFLRARPLALPLALGALLLVWASFLAAPARASAILASQGAWSRPLIGALQRATDFDGDGYSSFLGGGDCAPFDAAINPGAAEIVGDGVDNNCIGGDAGKASAPHRPLWGQSAHGSPANLNVVIVTIEAMRRDHASFVSAGRDTTPTLRGLASSSLVFERMYSAAPYTRLALASLFSSYAPSEIDWQLLEPEKHMRHISPATPWLPELLRARGYETIAVLTDFSAFTAQEGIGFERGFVHYDTSTRLEYRGGTMWGFPAATQVDKALGYVEHAARPFLLWLHLFEPHYRYEQPPDAPVFGGDEQSRYDAEIWHTDHQLGRLLDGLQTLGLWDTTVLFVSGDHGEAFGEHDDRWHGTNLFDPQLRPGALLRVPGVVGKRVDVSVTFTDVAPTLARVLGDRQTFEQLRGRSLAPLMHHRTLPDGEPAFVAETFNIEDGRAYQAALVAQQLKLIYSEQGRRFAFFDLAADPRELRPSEPGADPRAAPLLQQLIAYLERARPRTLAAPEAR